MSSKNKLSAFYQESARILCNELCSEYCCERCKCRMNVGLSVTANSTDISEMLYAVMDEISAGIRDSSDITVQTFSDFYGENEVIGWSAIKAEIKKSIRGCIHKDNSHDKLVTSVSKTIEDKLGIRIATIFHYKENHNCYDKAVAEAYSEVVETSAGDTKNLFTKQAYRKIQKQTREIHNYAVSEVYRAIYDKPYVKDKYKPSIESYLERINKSTPFVAALFAVPSYADDVWFKSTEYFSQVVKNIHSSTFVSWMDCYEKMSPNEKTMGKNTYLDLVKKHIPALMCVAEYLNENFTRDEYNGQYVAETIMNELNHAVSLAYQLFKKKGKSYTYNSLFELINALDDLITLDEVVDTYMQMIALRFGYMGKYQEMIDFLNAVSNTNLEELQVIHSVVQNLQNQ